MNEILEEILEIIIVPMLEGAIIGLMVCIIFEIQERQR